MIRLLTIIRDIENVTEGITGLEQGLNENSLFSNSRDSNPRASNKPRIDCLDLAALWKKKENFANTNIFLKFIDNSDEHYKNFVVNKMLEILAMKLQISCCKSPLFER